MLQKQEGRLLLPRCCVRRGPPNVAHAAGVQRRLDAQRVEPAARTEGGPLASVSPTRCCCGTTAQLIRRLPARRRSRSRTTPRPSSPEARPGRSSLATDVSISCSTRTSPHSTISTWLSPASSATTTASRSPPPGGFWRSG